MGREPYTSKVKFLKNGSSEEREVEFFAWEKLDYVDRLKKEFKIK
jgi:S-adenosylmethionine synthetase